MDAKKIEKRPVGRPPGNRDVWRLTMVLDRAMHRRIEEVAASEQISKGEVIRRALDHAFRT
jgi:Ribbon-helix-helix protein, copG family